MNHDQFHVLPDYPKPEITLPEIECSVFTIQWSRLSFDNRDSQLIYYYQSEYNQNEVQIKPYIRLYLLELYFMHDYKINLSIQEITPWLRRMEGQRQGEINGWDV